jgi:hypothetical protein
MRCLRRISPLQLYVWDVGEADAHGGVFAGVMDISEINDAASVAGAEFIESGVEPSLFLIATGHDIGDGRLEKFGGVISLLTESGEHHSDLEDE